MSSAPWQPRALKKRGAEFAVEGDAPPENKEIKPEPAESKPSTSGASSSSWNGAADLDDLEGENDKEKAAAKAEEPPEKKAKTEDPNRDEVADGAPRLAQHIQSASKFNKVAAMAYALLESNRVTRSNAGAFFAVLEGAMANPLQLRDKTYRVAYRKLFQAAIHRSHLFPDDCQPMLKLWEVQVLSQVDLHTDDTFQFNRAAKTVREALHGLPCVYKALEPDGVTHLPEGDRQMWAMALFDCVQAAMHHHKYGWAKTTCDLLVKTIVERRQNFPEEMQEEMQVWNATCKGQKVVRQQEHMVQKGREVNSFERKEAEWRNADIKSTKGGDGANVGGGLDGWCAKQSLN